MDIVFVGTPADLEEFDALLEEMVESLGLDEVLEEMLESLEEMQEEPVENVVPEDPEDDEDDEDVAYELAPNGLRFAAEMRGFPMDENTFGCIERWYEERNAARADLKNTFEVADVFHGLLLRVVNEGLPHDLFDDIVEVLSLAERVEG